MTCDDDTQETNPLNALDAGNHPGSREQSTPETLPIDENVLSPFAPEHGAQTIDDDMVTCGEETNEEKPLSSMAVGVGGNSGSLEQNTPTQLTINVSELQSNEPVQVDESIDDNMVVNDKEGNEKNQFSSLVVDVSGQSQSPQPNALVPLSINDCELSSCDEPIACDDERKGTCSPKPNELNSCEYLNSHQQNSPLSPSIDVSESAINEQDKNDEPIGADSIKSCASPEIFNSEKSSDTQETKGSVSLEVEGQSPEQRTPITSNAEGVPSGCDLTSEETTQNHTMDCDENTKESILVGHERHSAKMGPISPKCNEMEVAPSSTAQLNTESTESKLKFKHEIEFNRNERVESPKHSLVALPCQDISTSSRVSKNVENGAQEQNKIEPVISIDKLTCQQMQEPMNIGITALTDKISAQGDVSMQEECVKNELLLTNALVACETSCNQVEDLAEGSKNVVVKDHDKKIGEIDTEADDEKVPKYSPQQLGNCATMQDSFVDDTMPTDIPAQSRLDIEATPNKEAAHSDGHIVGDQSVCHLPKCRTPSNMTGGQYPETKNSVIDGEILPLGNENKHPMQCIMNKNKRPATPGHGLRHSSKRTAATPPCASGVASPYPSRPSVASKEVSSISTTASLNSSPFGIFLDNKEVMLYTPSPGGRFPRKAKLSTGQSTGKSRKKRIFPDSDKENINPNATSANVSACGSCDSKRARTVL
ncbi:Aste57867_18618 [Aphanomyces stellatus]|uniref:Aste57867_18618 protein n=1 Tax=Aphanomyces stellatus TaxID=120398 RepID=A0A485LAL2_9STRA|nr:hypothetical protein As57867_018556 [Aphanomyces stellatus]VFT95353.1 Aste57867_18618 [Aphanomyces stellatus]